MAGSDCASIGAQPGDLLAPGDPPTIAQSAASFGLLAGDDVNALECQKIASGDTDGDTIPNGSDPDDDNDGCTDEEELGTDPALGGLRQPHRFWDFFDPNRDRSISVLDVLLLLQRFGAVGDPTIDPLSEPPPAPVYHTRFDRGPVVGQHPWDLGPPDGAIALTDVLSLLGQFGHACTG